MQPLPCEVRDDIEREEQQLVKHMAVLRNEHILAFGEVFETSLTSSNSSNLCFAVLTLYLHMADRPKSMCCPCVGSKIIEMHVQGIHYEYVNLINSDKCLHGLGAQSMHMLQSMLVDFCVKEKKING